MSAPSTILHKRNSNSGVVPATTSLSAGEIAVNTADGKLFTKTTNNTVKTFLNAEQQPYTLDASLSSSNYQYGSNTVTGILAGVLGGVNNDVSGAGSAVVNGSDNDIDADYAFIGNGSNNTILTGGDFGAILGGQNNTLNHQESFILGSNITSHLSGFTYVNNLSSTGKIYGDGSGLTGIVSVANQYTHTHFLPLTGGTITGSLSVQSLSAQRFEVASSSQTAVLYTASSGKVGINTESPNKELTVIGSISSSNVVYVDSDVEITNNTKGIILKSPNNTRWRITVTDAGTLSAVSLA